jgi:uncharacterized protein YndB with AHSA1/START domain
VHHHRHGLFASPRPLVYQAFADPAQVIHWWGPHSFTLTIQEMDLRPGGKWRHIMHGPDGVNYPNEITFTAVVPFERVEQDLIGGKQGAACIHLHQTLTWEDEDGGTRLTIRSRFETRELRDHNVRTFGAVQGVRDLFERLEKHLAEAASR